jgi:hypothetical protein
MVMMNNKVMSAAQGMTKLGAVSLYNKGFFPKKGGMVVHSSNFGKIARTYKLFKSTEDDQNSE